MARPYTGPYKGMTRYQIMVAMLKKYPGQFYASHPTRQRLGQGPKTPDPIKIKHTYSGVLEQGMRVWAFETCQERDDFIKTWPLAQQIEEPKV